MPVSWNNQAVDAISLPPGCLQVSTWFRITQKKKMVLEKSQERREWGVGGGGCVPTDSAQTSRVEGKERKDVCVSLCDHAPALNLRPPERLFVDQRRSTIF